jgi:hypothetical protein
MKVAVLADDDGHIIAMAHCRMSLTGQVGTFTEDAEIRAEVSRSTLNAYRGRVLLSDRPASTDDIITSVILELPTKLHHTSLAEIQDTMVLDRSGSAPCFATKPKAG